MKGILIFFTIMIGGMIYFHHSLENGTVLKYIDEHQQEQWVPKTTYYIGEGYYLFQNLQDATTYFLRVAQRYPAPPLGDDAYFSYLQCLDDMVTVTRAELVEGYKAYLEKYPTGKHAEIARDRLGTYSTGAH